MRKYLIGALVIALSVGAVASVSAHTGNQSIDITTTKKKFPAKKAKPTGLKVGVFTDVEAGSDLPAKANQTTLFFAKNLKFNTKARPKCTANLENTTIDQAKAACPGKSQVSVDGPDSSAQIMLGASSNTYDAVVTAFNGPKANQITLHSRVEALGATTILIGTLKKLKSKLYGYKLTVPVPLIAGGGGAISIFKTFVKAGGYIKSTCKSRTMNYMAKSTYNDHDPSTAKDKHKCKRA